MALTTLSRYCPGLSITMEVGHIDPGAERLHCWGRRLAPRLKVTVVLYVQSAVQNLLPRVRNVRCQTKPDVKI